MKIEPADFNVVFITDSESFLSSEGLVVLLCDLCRGLVDCNVRVNIFTTDRHAESLKRVLFPLGDNRDPNYIQLVSFPVGSADLVKVTRTRAEKWPIRIRWQFPMRALSLVSELTYRRLSDGLIARVLKFGVRMTGLALIVPAFLVVGIFATAWRFASIARGLVRRAFSFLKRRGILPDFGSGRGVARRKLDDVRNQLKKRYFTIEKRKFSRELNKHTAVKRVFFFTPYDGDLVASLNAKAMVVFPDSFPYLLPLRFKGAVSVQKEREIAKALSAASSIITYSEFVKRDQLEKIYSSEVDGKPIHVIPQGAFSNQDENAEYQTAVRKVEGLNLFPTLLAGPPYFYAESCQYVVYPTIDRQNKNSLTLIKAIRILLRERYRNVKLVLTSPSLWGGSWSYVYHQRLHYDVVCTGPLSERNLERLIKGAACIVHPSLAEGGDIFNFSRAASAGVPCLMADVPAAKEMLSRCGQVGTADTLLFDPFDEIALADKMESILIDGASMLSVQEQAYAILRSRSFGDMARDYYTHYLQL